MALQGSGSGASAAEIRAGRASVEISADILPLKRALDNAGQTLRKFGGQVRTIGVGVSTLGAAILTPVLAAANAALQRGDAAKKAADRLGITAEAYTALGHAASMSGVDVDRFSAALDKFRAKVEGPLDAAIAQLADQIAATTDPLEKARLAVDAFGESGLRLVPLLQGGSAGLQALIREADRVGEVVTGDNAARAERIGDSISRAWKSARNIILAVGEAIFPQADMIGSVSERIVDFARSIRLYINNNKEMVQATVAVGGVIVGLGAALGGLSLALTAGGMLFSGLSLGITAAGAALSALVSPIGLSLAAATAFFTATETGRAQLANLTDYITDVLSPVIEDLKTTWQGVADALRAGDLALAGEIALAGLELAFKRGKLEVVKVWQSLVLELKNIWFGLFDLIEQKYDNFVSIFAKGINNLQYQLGLIDFDAAKAINDAISQDMVEASRARDKAERAAAAARRQEMAAAVAAAREEIAAAEQQLAELVAKARAAAEMPQVAAPQLSTASQSQQLLRQATAASGVFSTFGRSAQIFGGDRLVALNVEQNKLLAQIRDRVGVRFQ